MGSVDSLHEVLDNPMAYTDPDSDFEDADATDEQKEPDSSLGTQQTTIGPKLSLRESMNLKNLSANEESPQDKRLTSYPPKQLANSSRPYLVRDVSGVPLSSGKDNASATDLVASEHDVPSSTSSETSDSEAEPENSYRRKLVLLVQ